MARHYLTFDELMDLAADNYTKGGSGIYECWDKSTFDSYVKECGPLTKAKALKLFREDMNQMDDVLGWY